MKLKNIPNILSVIRIILVFVFVYTFFFVDEYAAMIVFLTAGATDVVDGYLARRNNWITNIGKILDPFADKLMQCTVLISLYIKKLIPIWFVVPFIVKEFVTLLMGLIVIRKRSVVVVSKWYGKMTVCLFYATVILSVLIDDILKDNIALTIIVFLPATVCALLAFGAYVKHYAGLRHKNDKSENIEEKAETAANAADRI